jgi:integrase
MNLTHSTDDEQGYFRTAPPTLGGKRDYATLAILLDCGLRRAELTTLQVEDIQQREEHWGHRRSCRQGRAYTYHSNLGLGESWNLGCREAES